LVEFWNEVDPVEVLNLLETHVPSPPQGQGLSNLEGVLDTNILNNSLKKLQ